MLYPGVTHGRVLPTRMYYVTNGLMFVIYGLQIMWWVVGCMATQHHGNKQQWITPCMIKSSIAAA
jgi:hypothetical protein